MSQAEYKAQEMANSRMAEVLYANDGGAALMKINELAADPGQMKMVMHMKQLIEHFFGLQLMSFSMMIFLERMNIMYQYY